jgi:hypothetical protein
LIDTQLTLSIDENMKLTDCYYEKKDWRACKQEVSRRRFSRGVLREPRCCRDITIAFQTRELMEFIDGNVPSVLAEAWK